MSFYACLESHLTNHRHPNRQKLLMEESLPCFCGSLQEAAPEEGDGGVNRHLSRAHWINQITVPHREDPWMGLMRLLLLRGVPWRKRTSGREVCKINDNHQ